MPTVNLIPKDTFVLEVDGEKIPGEFYIESEWNGFACLVCEGPHRRIIIKRPDPPTNHFDRLLRFLGGNRAADAPVVLGVSIIEDSKS